MYQEFFPMYCVIYGIVSIVHILMSHYQLGKMRCGKFVVNIVSGCKYLSSKICQQIFKQNLLLTPSSVCLLSNPYSILSGTADVRPKSSVSSDKSAVEPPSTADPPAVHQQNAIPVPKLQTEASSLLQSASQPDAAKAYIISEIEKKKVSIITITFRVMADCSYTCKMLGDIYIYVSCKAILNTVAVRLK